MLPDVTLMTWYAEVTLTSEHSSNEVPTRPAVSACHGLNCNPPIQVLDLINDGFGYVINLMDVNAVLNHNSGETIVLEECSCFVLIPGRSEWDLLFAGRTEPQSHPLTLSWHNLHVLMPYTKHSNDTMSRGILCSTVILVKLEVSPSICPSIF